VQKYTAICTLAPPCTDMQKAGRRRALSIAFREGDNRVADTLVLLRSRSES
jgi:hypothetical protein